MSDFERVKLDVLGWNVLVTSWLDPQTDTWKASAPALTRDARVLCPGGFPSREGAIADLIRELELQIRARARADAHQSAKS